MALINPNPNTEEIIDRIFYSGHVALSNEFAHQLYESYSDEVIQLLIQLDYNIKLSSKNEVLEKLLVKLEELFEEN
jgi:hypothetical protein